MQFWLKTNNGPVEVAGEKIEQLREQGKLHDRQPGMLKRAALLIVLVIAGTVFGQTTVQSVKSRTVRSAHKKYLQDFRQIDTWYEGELAKLKRAREPKLRSVRSALVKAIDAELKKAVSAEDLDKAIRLRDLKKAIESGEQPDLSSFTAQGIKEAREEYLQAVQAVAKEQAAERTKLDQQRGDKLGAVRTRLTDVIDQEIKVAIGREDLDEAVYLKTLKDTVLSSDEPVEMYDFAGMTKALNNQPSWRIVKGKWAIKGGRIVGSGDSKIGFKHKLAPEGVLTFKMNVQDGLRPRIHLADGIWFGNEGYERRLNFHSHGKLNDQGHPYVNGSELRVKIVLGPNRFRAYVNDTFVSSAPRAKGKPLKLTLQGGDGWSPGKTEYYELSISPLVSEDTKLPTTAVEPGFPR